MICVECGRGQVLPNTSDFEVAVRGEKVQVIGFIALVCDVCNHTIVPADRMPDLMREASDAYRGKHGLLKSSDIRERRGCLGMSQDSFAGHLGVGVASIKRWEMGQVQDRAMDQLIRLKTDPTAARNNLKALESQIHEEYVVSSWTMDLDPQAFSSQTFTTKQPMRVDSSGVQPIIGEDVPLAA